MLSILYTVYGLSISWSLMYDVLLKIIFISSNMLLLLNASGPQGLFCNPDTQYLAKLLS